MSQFHLVGFDFCPFLQPSLIVLKEKAVNCRMSYLTPEPKPAWLFDYSPSGRTPFLLVDEQVLFDSAVICEYLEEVTEGSLYPDDPWAKAQQRRWVAFSEQLLEQLYRVKTALDSLALVQQKRRLIDMLAPLDSLLAGRDYFQNQQFGFIEAAYAPVFRLIYILDSEFSCQIMAQLPGLANWSHSILARPSVQQAVVADYRSIVVRQIVNSSAAISKASCEG